MRNIVRLSILLFSTACSGLVFADPVTVKLNGIHASGGQFEQVGNQFSDQKIYTTSKRTRDHYCVKRCEGSSRIPYQIDYSVSPDEYKIIDAQIECEGVTCENSELIEINHSETRAWAKFDVWSKPTKWILTVTAIRVANSNSYMRPVGYLFDEKQVEEGKTFIVEHDPHIYTDVEIEATLPKLGMIRMNPSAPIAPYFKKIGESTFGDVKIYTIQYVGEGGE